MREIFLTFSMFWALCVGTNAFAQTATVDCLCDNGGSFSGHRFVSPPYWLSWCQANNGKRVFVTAYTTCEYIGACSVQAIRGTVAITLQSCNENPNFVYKWSLQGPPARSV